MSAWHGLLAKRLADRYRATPAGHAARLNGLLPDDARAVCQRLREELAGLPWDIVVVDDETSDVDGLSVRIDTAIERRNDKTMSRFYIIPQGQVAEAAASLADTESHELTEHLADLSRQLLKSLSPSVRPVAEAARPGVKASAMLDYLTALGEEPTLETMGRELWRLGLIPDRDPTPERVARNRSVVATLADARLAGGSVHARTSVAQIRPPEIAAAIAARLRGAVVDENWLCDLGEDPELSFDRFVFPGAPSRLRDITVLSYYDAKATRAQAWTGLVYEDGTLKAYLQGDPKRVVTRWRTDPEAPTDEVSYEVTLETCDPEPEILLSSVVRHRRARYQSWSFDPKEAPVQVEGSLRVRVSIRALGGEPQVVAYGFEFLLDNGEGPPPPPSALPPVRSLPDFLFDHADAGMFPEITGRGEFSGDSVTVELDGRHRRRVPLVRLLVEAERASLADPSIVLHRLPMTAEGAWSRDNIVSTQADRAIRELLSEDWWRLRRRLFAALSAGGSLVESALLGAYQADIVSYARTYTSALVAATRRPTELARLLLLDVLVVSDSDVDLNEAVLLVSPLHPIRLLWHLSHELLLRDWAAKAGRPGVALREAARMLDGSRVPAFLAAATNLFSPAPSPVFGWPEYVSMKAADPARLTERVRRGLGLVSAATVDWGSPDVGPLADRIKEYAQLHPHLRTLKLEAVNPDDARLLIGALAQVDEIAGAAARDYGIEAYELSMFGQPPVERLGSLLDEAANTRQRAVALPNRVESLFRSSGSYLRPHVSWSKRRLDRLLGPDDPADRGSHLAVVLDYIGQRTTCVPELALEPGDDTAAYGLVAVPSDHPMPDDGGSFATVRVSADGPPEPHPSDRTLSRELARGHRAILLAAAAVGGGEVGSWPGTVVAVSEMQGAVLERLHARADWVITLDANAPIDYFDSPKSGTASLRENANRFVIDIAPTRPGARRLLVSTAHVGELHGVLRDALRELAITPSELAFEEVLQLLKSISGHIVMRLARDPENAKEIVALAVVREILRGTGALETGFLVPIDDHQPVLVEPGPGGSLRRADLLLVQAKGKKQLDVSIIEVKFRRHEYIARDPALAADMAEATAATEASLRRRFFPLDRDAVPHWPLGRSELRGLLDFHLARARRHGLIDRDIATTVQRVVNDLQRADLGVKVSHVGYVYCPAFAGATEQLTGNPNISVTLIGRGALPRYTTLQPSEPAGDVDEPFMAPPAAPLGLESGSTPGSLDSHGEAAPPSGFGGAAARPTEPVKGPLELPAADIVLPDLPREEPAPSPSVPVQPGGTAFGPFGEARVLLGHDPASEREVVYRPSIRGNPHLLMVGIPGMGKTTALVNICESLAHQAVYPFVIDFHGDISSALGELDLGVDLAVLDASAGIPFNPLELDPVRRAEPNGWKVQAHEIAEIFGNIFPSFGELQVGELRDSLRAAYEDAGFGSSSAGRAPRWSSFWENLQAAAEGRPDVRKITTRLDSVFDLGLFADNGEGRFATLDELLRKVTVVDLHRIPIEENQRVAASFFLHRLYRAMFSGDRPSRLETLVVFDEAHRVARLKLLPRMMQESRKFGMALLVSSQRVEDFDQGVLDSAGNHLYLRVNHPDARRLASYLASGLKPTDSAGVMQSLRKYEGLFRSEDYQPFARVRLRPPATPADRAE